MVLCVLLLFAPVTHSQGFRAVKQKFVISGSVGLAGVTMQGLPGAPSTNENGVYSVEVEYGWKGVVTPVKVGYTFEPKQKEYTKVTENLTTEDYQANLKTFAISGTTGQPGVTMQGLPGDPVSDQAGLYAATVTYGWVGTVIPVKEGYRFEPSSKSYTSVEKDMKNENYTAQVQTFVISGSVGVEGVTMKGLPGDPKTTADGVYRVEVPYGWDGTVTPTKEGHEFTPEFRTYADVMEMQTNQNYQAKVFTFQVSGSANMAGVQMVGLPGDPITDTDGYYSATVNYGWEGKVTPTKAGYVFDPPSKSYAKVTSNFENENYNPSLIKLTISGNTGTAGVKMVGLDNVVSDTTGAFAATVEYGWSGSVTPQKEGYTFDPPNLNYSSVTADQLNQNFKAEAITYTIAGNTSLPGVILQGLPGQPVSGADGSYTATVGYKWKGTVTPRRDGYTFEPEKREYPEVTSDMLTEDYLGKVLQYTISGKVTSQVGPVADAMVLADNSGGQTTTDANGTYQLQVNHGWQGKVTVEKPGYNFTPPSRLFQPVLQDIASMDFNGEVQMMTITDSIIFGDEPIQGVTITAKPGDYQAVTDAKGKYSLKVPYGWAGELIPQKEGFVFNPPSISYAEVTENIDRTAPTRTPPPPADTTPSQPVTPVDTTPSQPRTASQDQTPPPVETPTTDTTTAPPEPEAASAEKQELMDRIDKLQDQLDALLGTPGVTPLPGAGGERAGPEAMVGPREVGGPTVSGTFIQENLLDVLTSIANQAGVMIYVDETVKPTPVSVKLTNAPLGTALREILREPGYKYERMGDDYLVFLPITNAFMGDELREALQLIAAVAGVSIVPDETVTGQVYADLQGVPLETALDIVLAGTPYVVKKTPNYYLVANRNVDGSAFPEISETRYVRMNYISAETAVQLLSPAFSKYVKAEGVSDPNSFGIGMMGGGARTSGHVVTVTAPPALADRIVADLRQLDMRPRHVLLDARVVAMERGDLLNLGVEWNFPTASAGALRAGGGDIDTDWRYGLQIGFSFDQTFTNALLATLNMLQENQQADIISSPQVLAQDGKRSEIRVVTEEYYMLTPPVNSNLFYTQSELEKIESGTILTITPHVGDNNDITLEMSVEVSDSIPSGRVSDLPVVTRRTASNRVTVYDGGTVALAGLTENRTKIDNRKVPGLSGLPLIGGLFRNESDDRSTREIAVFVTAHLVPDTRQMYGARAPRQQRMPAEPAAPARGSFRQDLEDSLLRQRR
jgi:hypothetical protein